MKSWKKYLICEPSAIELHGAICGLFEASSALSLSLRKQNEREHTVNCVKRSLTVRWLVDKMRVKKRLSQNAWTWPFKICGG